jgi:hypothetical protein
LGNSQFKKELFNQMKILKRQQLGEWIPLQRSKAESLIMPEES